MKRLILLLIIFSVAKTVHAQEKFEVMVSAAGGIKVKVEWKNPYGDSLVQLNVQRSWDSMKGFRTVFVPLSPELPQNGFIDETAGYNGMYYRIFYVRADGTFFFTKSKKVTTGSDFTTVTEQQASDKNFMVTIHDDDSVIAQLSYDGYKRFRDSIVNYTRDTLYSLTDADILIRYYNNEISWIPSIHIFTNTDGYVQVSLADATNKKYRLRILDEYRKQVFNIQHITQPQLLLDKTDFMHSGWFYFELYENDKLKERNKFYIPKDF
jgi:hypothetical protein